MGDFADSMNALARMFSLTPEPNPHVACQMCGAVGTVVIQRVSRAVGFSGKKAGAALLTGGASLIFGGLTRNEMVTECSCQHCGLTYNV